MKRKRNKLKYVRDKKEGKIKMVNRNFSSFQFCFQGGERHTCFCFTCKVVPNAYSPVCKAFCPEDVLNRGNEDLFLSYVAPYFEYQTAYEIILLDI